MANNIDYSKISTTTSNNIKTVFDDGRFNIALFHGTSTAFLPSILQNGLGGVDIITDLRALELFEKLVHLIEEHLPDYGEGYINQMKLILQQKNGTKWRHGGAFITPSMDRAVKYAVNSYGSELLSMIHGIHEDVTKYIPGTEGIIDEYEEIKQLFAAEHRPLLVVADDVELENIQSEDGNEASQSLHNFFMLLGDDVSSENIRWAGQQANFKLVKPKVIDMDCCFEIVFHHRDKLHPKYELRELTKI